MPRFTIRLKLLLLSVVMLSVPYVGFQYLRETERYLQSGLEDSLLAVASAMAISLQGQANLFRGATETAPHAMPLFVHALAFQPHIDGYIDDWASYATWADRFESVASDSAARTAEGFEVIVGEYGNTLNLAVTVDDETLFYQQHGSFSPREADTIELLLDDGGARRRRVYLATAGPGPLTGYAIAENWDFSESKIPVASVVGHWRETEHGYVVEIQLPLPMARAGLGITHYDIDPGNSAATITRSADRASTPNVLLRTSAQLQQLIDRVGLKSGRRLWVLNRTGQVLASSGSLANETKRGAINILYTWILPRATSTFEDDLRSASRLRSAEVLRALNGEAATRWRSSPDERAVIVSAAHPVRRGNELMGVIVVEETTNSIQTLQRDAMASLFNQSIAVFVGVSLVLLLFASRLSFRIRKLRDQAERATDAYGKVVAGIEESRAADEIGDLSRSFASMLARLTDYNAYLESMAGKLSHELRTPLTVVSSSLENLDSVSDPVEQARYLSRAREGLARLHGLVSRLGEAARLEQSIVDVNLVEFDITALIRGCVDGYRNAYGSHSFALKADNECIVLGSDDLIVQLLDKLVANAVSFGTPNTPVEVCLTRGGPCHSIQITNRGSRLPETMQRQIFNSMISMRESGRDGEPHLGLGLFIARLIVERHDGVISAFNLPDGSGVTFEVELPNRRFDSE